MKEFDNNLLKEKKIVLIDFFDTLVHRKVTPEDIKQCWAKKVSQVLNYNVSPENVYYSRKEAENDLEKKYGYGYSYDKLINAISCRMFDAGIYCEDELNPNELLKIESDIESENLYLDCKIKGFLDYCKKNGKLVYVVSDYHMGENVIRDYLVDLGIDKYFDGYFISCDYVASKFDGTLYEVVLNQLRSQPSECIMVGDNLISDIAKSKEYGIDSIHRPYKQDTKQIERSYYEKWLSSMLDLNGYSGYCYSLSLFTEKLYKNLKKLNARKAFFLSREGEFLKKIFDLYINIIGDSSIETNYLYVSRQSTFVPSLNEDVKKENFENLFRQFNDISVEDFLLNIGFSSEEIENLSPQIDIDFKTIIKNFSQSSEFQLLKDNCEFITKYQKVVSTQKELFGKYLRQEGYDFSSPLYIVDVGWKGTMQDNLARYLGNDKKIVGFYVGYGEITYGKRNLNNQKKGLLFSIVPYKTVKDSFWSLDAGLFEKILYASHPSTSGYTISEKKIIPKFKRYKEEQGVFEIIKPIQDDIYRNCKDIFEKFSLSKYFIEEYEDVILKLHIKVILNMNHKKIKFRKLVEERHFENFGTFNTIKVGMKHNNVDLKTKIIHFVRRLKQLFSPEYFIRNCYNMDKIHNPLFWKFYSNIVIKKAYKTLDKNSPV